MDIRMPGMDGLEATRRLVAQPAEAPRVLVLTTFDLDEYVYEALRGGASGFLLKGAPADRARARRARGGGGRRADQPLGHPAPARRVRAAGREWRAAAGLEELTSRERDVLDLIAKGRSNPEIAEELVVTPATVKTHVAHILMKLGVRDRVQAVILLYESGAIEPGRSS